MRYGKGAEYVDVSSTILVLVTKGYFQSPNCMREMMRAVVTGKPIVVMLEPEASHGGLGRCQGEAVAAHALESCAKGAN